ncbi:MAG: hypothetical protein ACI9U2_004091 [Bradymonadia bacterium]
MIIALVMAPVAASSAVLWRFIGPEGETLRAAAVDLQRSGMLAGHLLDDAAINARLAEATLPDDLGCLEDHGTCEDPRQAVLALAGLSARVDATMGVGDNNTRTVTLRMLPANPNSASQSYIGSGADVASALADAVGSLEGQGTLEISVIPNDARLYLDGAPLGTGSARYPVPPGTHEIRAEADGFSPLSQPIEVKAGMIVPVSFILGNSYGELTLEVTPKDARVSLSNAQMQNKPLLTNQKAHPLSPGDYQLRVEAPGYAPHEQTITIKKSTLLTLSVRLPRANEDFWSRFATPHADTLANRFYVRGSIRFLSIGDGAFDVDGIDTVDESVGLVGLSVGVGYRGRYFLLEAINLSYAGGGGRTPVSLAGSEDEAVIDELSRITIRPGWIGARYPSWRVEPFIMGGIELTFEDFIFEDATSSTRALSKSDLLLGIELGVRGQILPEWFLSASGVFDFAPSTRPSAAFILGVGYCFDVPGLF